MLGILLIYFIGKQFYNLAQDYNKNKWLFAILGIVAYYAGTIIGGIVLAFTFPSLLYQNEIILGLIAIPFGLLSTTALYFILKNIWSKNHNENIYDLIDTIGEDKTNENINIFNNKDTPIN